MLMRYLLLFLLIFFNFNVLAIDEDAAHNKALADSAALEAKDNYQEGINAKLANRFEDARIIFGNLADFAEPGTEQWARLAADELNYGLLMHEVNYWLIKMGGQDASREPIDAYIKRAQERLRQIIELNADKPERIIKAQQMLSQSTITKQAYANVNQANTRSKLTSLKRVLRVYFNDTGNWPEKRWLEKELKNTLLGMGLSKNHYTVGDYWKSDSSFYLLLKDSAGGSYIKMKGNKQGGISLE